MDPLIPNDSAALKTALTGMASGARSSSRGNEGGIPFGVEIVISGQPARIQAHYADLVSGPLEAMSRAAGVLPPQPNLGLRITFGQPNDPEGHQGATFGGG
jgi:hypothetical protein